MPRRKKSEGNEDETQLILPGIPDSLSQPNASESAIRQVKKKTKNPAPTEPNVNDERADSGSALNSILFRKGVNPAGVGAVHGIIYVYGWGVKSAEQFYKQFGAANGRPDQLPPDIQRLLHFYRTGVRFRLIAVEPPPHEATTRQRNEWAKDHTTTCMVYLVNVIDTIQSSGDLPGYF